MQEKGRRSNNLQAWADPLFEWLLRAGFDQKHAIANEELISGPQGVVARRLTLINEDKPLIARYRMGSAVAVIEDILNQAQEKKRAKDVAEYLVGAKLQLRFGDHVVDPKNVNAPSLGNLADFRVGNAAIEVTTVERPDKSHLEQIAGILQNTGLEIWLLTRMKDREKWRNAIEALFQEQASRVVIADIETFVGQNMTEIGAFKADDTKSALASLFDRYADHWLPPAGSGGLKIVDLEKAPS